MTTHLLLALLWVLWCILHSVMIARPITDFLSSQLKSSYRFYRLFFNITALATLIPVYFYSISLDSPTVFELKGILEGIRIFVFAVSILLFFLGARTYDMRHFLGMNDIRAGTIDPEISGIKTFKTQGILNVIRHPWYLAGILLVWTRTGRLTVAALLENSIITLYFIIGAYLEEKKLEQDLGGAYQQYREAVSMLLPVKWVFRFVCRRCTRDISAPAPPERPVLAVGAVVFHQDRVLLVQRGNPPARGEWAIPGGRVRLGETLARAAEREIEEETNVIVSAGKPVFSFENIDRDRAGKIQFHYYIVDLEARYISGTPRAGDDAEKARWVSVEELGRNSVNRRTLDLLHTQYGFGPAVKKTNIAESPIQENES